MKPLPCSHENVICVQERQVVYGPVGFLPARYECTDCGVYWDDEHMTSAERRALHRAVYKLARGDSSIGFSKSSQDDMPVSGEL